MRKGLFISLLSVLTVSAFSQDLKLWYDKPAAKWTDALPIGNGRLGAMIFGGMDQDRIQFNEETLWTGEPRDYNRKGAYKYLPQLRQLLFDGKQKEAEALAEEEFMGVKSGEGDRAAWIKKVTTFSNQNNPSLFSFNDSKWNELRVPTYDGWESVGLEGLDGAVWFRTTFDLPEGWQDKNLVLDLNRIRDVDYTYVNG
jgi:alpha-L-fucosidase 2